MRRSRLFLAAVLTATALATAGCGGDDDDGGGGDGGSAGEGGGAAGYGGEMEEKSPAKKGSAGGGQTLELSADPEGALAFDKSSLTAKAGKVTLVMDNPSSLPHAVSIEGNGLDKDGNTVMQGGVSKVSATLKPGEYEFYCPVDGHEDGGMKGTLTVE